MSFKKIKVKDLPRKKRTAPPSRVEQTPEWLKLRAALTEGLKPSEAFQIHWTPEEKAKYKIKSMRNAQRFVKKYVETCGLDYTVRTWNTDTGSIIAVTNQPLISQVA